MEALGLMYLVTVAIIWGLTNAMMKKYSEGIEHVSTSTVARNRILSTLQELQFALTNWKYFSACLLNQTGSLLYYYSLGRVDLSIASPLTNTLTFVFTYIAGITLFGEIDENLTLEKKLGLIMVCSGVILIMLDHF